MSQTTTAVADLQLLAQARRWCGDGTARRIREGLQLSQGEVARAAGVSHTLISHYERGDRLPRYQPGLAYARVLDALARLASRDPS